MKYLLMKKVVSLFVIALLMVSCNQEAVLVETPEVTPEVARPIGFDTFVDKSSRAAGENSTALNDFYPAFSVYGWKTVEGTTTPIFEDYAVSYVDDAAMYEKNYAAEWGEEFVAGWYYKNLRYWDKMASAYQFCAYAPVAASANVDCNEHGQITIGSSTAPVTVETKNLMATPAEKLAFTGFEYDYMTAVSTQTLDKVSLNFQHLQAKLNIRIRLNESVTTAQAVTITEIGVHNLGNKGYYDNKATEGVVSGWKLTTADADYVPAVTIDYPINGSDSKSGYYVLEQLILPQTIKKAATTEPSLAEYAEACLYVEYTIGDEVFKSFSPLANIFSTAETYKFEGGKQYTINVIVGPTPIEFTVDVVDWADAVEEDKEMN